MKDKNPANFEDYKSFIVAYEKQSKLLERGFRKRLAEALGCQSAFVSQVLNGPGHLSLEQGLRAARHFGLDLSQQKYFITMIEWSRAGTADLKAYFKTELDQQRTQILDLKHNVAASVELSDSGKAVYYSDWIYAALHMLVTIPRYQEPGALAAPLGLRESDVKSALNFLVNAGLISVHKGKLTPGQTQLHLNRDSEWIRQHHTQWRLRAIERVHRGDEQDLHYSTVSSLSAKDMLALQTKMVGWVRTYTETVRDSREEELCAFNLDFYKLND